MINIKYYSQGRQVSLGTNQNFDFKIEVKNLFLEENAMSTTVIKIPIKAGDNQLIYGSLNHMQLDANNREARKFQLWIGIYQFKGEEQILFLKDGILYIRLLFDNDRVERIFDKNQTVSNLGITDGVYEHNSIEGLARRIIEPGSCRDYKGIVAPIMVIEEEMYTSMQYNNYLVAADYPEHPESQDFGAGIFNYPWHTDKAFMPWLWFYIEKVAEKLGFKVIFNELKEDENLSKILIVRQGDFRNIFDMQPNWTVNKLFVELRKLFNLFVVVEGDEMYIVSMKTFYDMKAKINYNIEVASEKIKVIYNIDECIAKKHLKNIKYQYDETKSVTKHMKIDSSRDFISVNWWNEMMRAALGENYNVVESEDLKNTDYLANLLLKKFYVKTLGRYFRFSEQKEKDVRMKGILPYPEEECHDKLNYNINIAEYETEDGIIVNRNFNYNLCQIVPARMGVLQTENNNVKTYTPMPLLIRISNYSILTGALNYGNSIVNHESINKGNLYIATYVGTDSSFQNSKIPIVTTKDHLLVNKNGENARVLENSEIISFHSSNISLDIEQASNIIRIMHQKKIDIDFTREYHIKFFTHYPESVYDFYIIRNIKFVCRKLIFCIKHAQCSELYEGIFYRVN